MYEFTYYSPMHFNSSPSPELWANSDHSTHEYWPLYTNQPPLLILPSLQPLYTNSTGINHLYVLSILHLTRTPPLDTIFVYSLWNLWKLIPPISETPQCGQKRLWPRSFPKWIRPPYTSSFIHTWLLYTNRPPLLVYMYTTSAFLYKLFCLPFSTAILHYIYFTSASLHKLNHSKWIHSPTCTFYTSLQSLHTNSTALLVSTSTTHLHVFQLNPFTRAVLMCMYLDSFYTSSALLLT